MKKNVIIIITLIIVAIILFCGIYISLITHHIIEFSNYKDNTSNQENNLEVDKNEETLIQENKNIDVQFVRTFTVLANLKQTDATGEYNFYVVDQFQNFNPIVIKVNKEYNELEINQNYEFTFKGSKIEGKDYSIRDIFDTFYIINIEKTNKLGLEQIQDPI